MELYSLFLKVISDGSNNVQTSMFDCLEPKIECLNSITNRWTRSFSLDVQKNDVQVSLMSNLVNLVKALLGSKFNVQSFEAKNRVRLPIDEHVQVCSMFEMMMFESVWWVIW